MKTFVSVPVADLMDGDRVLLEGGPMNEVITLAITEIFDTGHGNVQLSFGNEKIWLPKDQSVIVAR